MFSGASQAGVALIMVPAGGNFNTTIANSNREAGGVHRYAREHSRLTTLLGVEHYRWIQVGTMRRYFQRDEKTVDQSQMGKKTSSRKNTPVLATSGWMCVMSWWTDMAVFGEAEDLDVGRMSDLEKV